MAPYSTNKGYNNFKYLKILTAERAMDAPIKATNSYKFLNILTAESAMDVLENIPNLSAIFSCFSKILK